MVNSSWELKQLRDNRVLVATISPPDGKVSYQWARAWKELQTPSGSDHAVIQGLPFGPARNYAITAMLKQDFSYLFFLDSDMLLPSDAILRLIKTGFPLIGCYYTHRFPPYDCCYYESIKNEEGKIVKIPLPSWNFGDIVPCTFLPAGACLIHRSVFETMINSGITKPYEWTLDIDEMNGISEDFSFSMKALSLGIQPYMHSGIQGKHECLAVCGPRGIEAVVS